MIPRHLPAFAGRIKDLFDLKPGQQILDLTLGDGGHTQEALEAGCQVVSVDIDEDSIGRAVEFISPQFTPLIVRAPDQVLPSNFRWLVLHANFKDIATWVEKLKLPRFHAVIADLGTSQAQLIRPERGFSFETEAPLDMRLDRSLTVTAKDLVNGLGEKELVELFALVDETYARPIARAIVNARRLGPIEGTTQLAQLILRVKSHRPSRIHPATKVFLALRLAVNLEREALSQMLAALPDLLFPGGRLGIISFHSGEDRAVKATFKDWAKQGLIRVMTVKPLVPTTDELQINPKVRSAKLRLAVKL